MNAPEIDGPRVSGCDRFSSTCTRPITVPMMPIVGAKPPALSKGSAAGRWGAGQPAVRGEAPGLVEGLGRVPVARGHALDLGLEDVADEVGIGAVDHELQALL